MEVLSEVQRRRLASVPMSAAPVEERRLVIAIDYGTTYTGVAIATPLGTRAALNEIDIVQDWGPRMGNHLKIPSVISYSLRSPAREEQWGTDLSPDAIAMVHTKLQLDVDDTSAELDLVLQALDGMQNLNVNYIIDSRGAPKYTPKGPEDIVQDYLTKVFDYLLKTMAPFTEALRKTIPVDIVATIPANWGYRAKNSTFRALTRAGFNRETFPQLRDVLLVTEPEAAAIYTSRFLKELQGSDFLRKGECFVLCDAGGGTVDVVSYKVKQLVPTFEIERVTIPTGYKCGSIFINMAFKTWLRKLLGDCIYQELDQAQLVSKISSHDAEGERMRVLMKRFDVHKRKFMKGHRDIKIDLPEPFENLDLDVRVMGGQITIKYEDMASFFEPSATRIVEMIDNQREQIEYSPQLRVRLKNVFLVGGFAESEYLQESIRESLDMRDLELRIPDTSWTAVVRGAAIFGIEKSTTKSLVSMSACTRSYGVLVRSPFSDVTHNVKDLVKDSLTNTAMARDQLLWLIKTEDLILSNEPKEPSADFTKNFTATGDRSGSIPIFVYDGDRNTLPDRLANAQREPGLDMFYTLQYDLSNIPLTEFNCVQHTPRSVPFYVAPLKLTLRLTSQGLTVVLHMKNSLVSAVDVLAPPIQD